MRRAFTLALAGLLLALPAAAQGGKGGTARFAALTPLQAVESLPQEIAGFARQGAATDFEQRPGGAGLGAAVEYRARQDGHAATVYVFTARMSGLAEGADSAEATGQLESAGRDIHALAQRRGYAVLAEGTATPIPGARGVALRCRGYVLQQPTGELDSYACVGVVGSRFLKIRMTLPRAAAAINEARLLAFGRGVVAAAGG